MEARLQQFVAWLTIERAVLLFLLLVLPIVFAPYHADDFFHLLILQQDPMLERGGDGSLLGLFSFVDDNPEHRAQLFRYGVLPWWASDNYHFRFWRPLGELTHWFDYAVFGANPLPAHIHSILWFLLASIPFYFVARKTLPESRALLLLCLAIFMWDGQHIGTISWIANRSALIAVTFALWSLYSHISWRQSNRGIFALLSHLLLVLALLGGEIGLSIMAYLFTWSWFLDKGTVKNRLLPLTGYGIIGVAYLCLHRHLDFGASTSDSYINIFTEPLDFLIASVERFFVYMASVFLPIPAGASRVGGDRYWYLAVILVVIGAITLPLLLYVSRNILRENRVLCFWLFGALLSTFPITSAPAQDRLTVFLTVGIDIFLACVIYYALINKQQASEYYKERSVVNTARAFVVIHLILSPMHLLGGTSIMHKDTRSLLNHALEFDDTIAIAGKKLVVLEMPLGISISMMGMRKAMGEQLPESAFFVGNEEGETWYKIISDNEMIVTRDIGFVIGYEMVFRSISKEPFRIGDRISMRSVEIEILSVNDQGRPLQVKLTFNESLQSDNWLFYHFGKKQWVEPQQL